MKHVDKWKPSKFIFKNGKLVASRDRREVGVFSRLMVDLIAGFFDEYISLYARGKLLDLGCGKVPLYETYSSYIDDCVCVDWQNSLHGNDHLDLHIDLNGAIPLADANFDTIVLSDVLEHIRKPENLWREMHRLLKPNGYLLISVPFYYWLHEQPHDYFRYTKHALRSMAEDVGLEIVVLESMGGVPEIMTDIFAKTVYTVPVIGNGCAILSQWMVGKFVKTCLGYQLSHGTSRNFPLGYFVVCRKNSDQAVPESSMT